MSAQLEITRDIKEAVRQLCEKVEAYNKNLIKMLNSPDLTDEDKTHAIASVVKSNDTTRRINEDLKQKAIFHAIREDTSKTGSITTPIDEFLATNVTELKELLEIILLHGKIDGLISLPQTH